MLLGVLRLPFDDRGDLHLMQLKQRCQEAADRIEGHEQALRDQDDKARAEERKANTETLFTMANLYRQYATQPHRSIRDRAAFERDAITLEDAAKRIRDQTTE